MKDLDREKILGGLKVITKKNAIEALNFMLTDHKFITSNRRQFYLKYFIQEKISEVIIVDREKLKEIEKIRRTGKEQAEVIPHAQVTDDFLNVLITAMKESQKRNFFGYERRQLFLIADERCLKPVEKVLRSMGLKIVYFKGILV